MAWVTPQTWTVGQLVGASEFNEQVRDNLNHLKILVDNNGKIPVLNSTYLADVSAAALTGIAKTASDNSFTSVNSFNGGAGSRFVLPIGEDKWATI